MLQEPLASIQRFVLQEIRSISTGLIKCLVQHSHTKYVGQFTHEREVLIYVNLSPRNLITTLLNRGKKENPNTPHILPIPLLSTTYSTHIHVTCECTHAGCIFTFIVVTGDTWDIILCYMLGNPQSWPHMEHISQKDNIVQVFTFWYEFYKIFLSL